MREPRPRSHGRDGLRQAAVLWTGGVRIGLWALPLPWLKRALVAVAELPRGRPRGSTSPAEVGAAVQAARRAVPHATCLVQAFAAWGMLRGLGHRPSLRLGLADPARQPFLAHAWVECEGSVVVGSDVSGHAVLGTLPLGEGVEVSAPKGPVHA